MKKTFALIIAAASFVACNDMNTDNAATDDRSDTSTSIGSSPSAINNAYAPADGDVTYREDKLLIMRNGEWVEAEEDVTLENGTVIYKDGRVKRDDKEVELENGEVVDKSGNFFDETGKAIEKGWNDTKEAAKEMGNDVKKAGEKAGDKAKDAVDYEDK